MEAVLVSSQAIKQADADHPIHPLLAERWSPRAFAAQPVERAKLLSLLEAARWSASANNRQPWRFIVARRGEEGFEKLLSVLSPFNVEWATAAPVLMLLVTKSTTDDGQFTPYGYYDAGLAMQNLTVQATGLGLHVHQMGGFSTERARDTFDIPEGYQSVVVAAVGYLGDPYLLPERRREAELSPRTRKPLTEFVYADTWGETAEWLD